MDVGYSAGRLLWVNLKWKRGISITITNEASRLPKARHTLLVSVGSPDMDVRNGCHGDGRWCVSLSLLETLRLARLRKPGSAYVG
jgi:hypothetical protein